MISDARFELRMADDEKSVIENVASLSGMTLSAYARAVLLEDARRRKQEFDMVKMCAQDARNIMDAMNKPFKPTPRMAAALNAAMNIKG